MGTDMGTTTTRKSENGKRKAENGKRKTENGKRKTESGKRRTECRERKAESGERKAENGERRTENGEVYFLYSLDIVGNIIDIKSKAFAVRIVQLVHFLQDKKHESVLSKQILRSGTSIGANARERKNAQSKADFVNKLAIALKEADETQYWLEILYESNIIEQEQFSSLNEELKEIIAIITSSIKTVKNNINNEK